MAKISGMKSINNSLDAALAADPKVVCLGEDIGKKGGCWGYFTGLEAKYGENRILEMPLAEQGYSGFAVGIGYGGYRPVVEYMFADFATLGFEAMVNMAAKFRYNSGGVEKMPITFMLPGGGGGKSGSQHSQSVEAWFANIPGIKIVAPTTPNDLNAYLQASIRDDDPVAFIFARGTLGVQEEEEEIKEIPSLLNAAKIVKEGNDLTIVSYHRPLLKAIEVVAEVEAETGKTIEIIDPRVLNPFDKEKVFASVKKTGKLLIIHEAPERGGFGTLISAWVSENCSEHLKAPVKRIGGYNTVIPFGKVEEFAYPQVEDIKAGIMEMLGK